MRNAARFFDLRGEPVGQRQLAGRQHPILVGIHRRIPEHNLAIHAARENDREFRFEIHQSLVKAGAAGEANGAGIHRRCDPPLALAIIAFAASLQNAQRAQLFDSTGQILFRIDGHIRRALAAMLLHEILLIQAILRGFQRERAGAHQICGNGGNCAQWDIFKLPGHNVTLRSQGGQRGHIAPALGEEIGADFCGYIVILRGIANHAQTQLRSGHGQHPSQLSAAQNAYG